MTYRRIRWAIVGLLFVSTAINYIDRQALSILSPILRREFHLDEAGYANAVTAFLAAYTVMYAVSGRWLDRVGVRVGMSVCIAWWSLATMLTSVARGAVSLAAIRFLLGIGEPGVYPAGLKACAEWFPRSARALPTGVFSSGSAMGAVLAPPMVAWITLQFGWRYAFLLPGAVGLLWIPLWLKTYRSPSQHPGVSPEDLARLADATNGMASRTWMQMLRQRKVWALVLPRLTSDPAWYFYLFWLPDYLQRERGMSLTQIGHYGWIPFLAADLGNLTGGASSDWLIRHGWTPRRARVAVLVGVGCLAPLGALVGVSRSTAVAIAFTCMVAFLTQCWSTNIATLGADLFESNERATISGMMGTAGSLGGILFAQVLAIVIPRFGYASAFALASVLHPISLLVLLLMLGRTAKAAPEAGGKCALSICPPTR